jgi:EamA domain-containing membrane protein RarD
VFAHSADAIVIARRKLALNLRLAGHSPWSAAGIAAAWALVLEWRRRKRMPNDSGLRQVSVAYLWGTGAILALNDSGVVAAAEMLLLASAAQWLSASHTVPADSAGGASAPA